MSENSIQGEKDPDGDLRGKEEVHGERKKASQPEGKTGARGSETI